jgi:DNA repair exonuclease SbcCD ATPase subunit
MMMEHNEENIGSEAKGNGGNGRGFSSKVRLLCSLQTELQHNCNEMTTQQEKMGGRYENMEKKHETVESQLDDLASAMGRIEMIISDGIARPNQVEFPANCTLD